MTVTTTLTAMALSVLVVVLSAFFFSREQSVLRPIRVKTRVRHDDVRRPVRR